VDPDPFTQKLGKKIRSDKGFCQLAKDPRVLSKEQNGTFEKKLY
jgi:hypothetical protein